MPSAPNVKAAKSHAVAKPMSPEKITSTKSTPIKSPEMKRSKTEVIVHEKKSLNRAFDHVAAVEPNDPMPVDSGVPWTY